MRTTFIPMLAALLGLAATAAHADDWNKTYRVGAHPHLSVSTDDARVSVLVGEPGTIGIRVHTEGWKIGSGGIAIQEEQSGDAVRFQTREPHFQWGISFYPHKVEIEVTVPRELALDVDTGDGNVTVAPVTGEVRVRTGDGSVDAQGLQGDLSLVSGDGHIRAHDLQGRLYAHTGDGGIAVSGQFTRLELSSGDGRIEATAGSGSKVSEGWDLHTGDGSIQLRVPRDLAADLEAETGDGSIDADLPVSVEGRFLSRHLTGHLNGGGAPIRLRSGDGSIHIAAL
jgi:Putative adhesin